MKELNHGQQIAGPGTRSREDRPGGEGFGVGDDQLERALLEQTVGSIRTQPCMVIAPDLPVSQALRTFVERDITGVLVAEDDHLLGLFTKRDVLDKVALQYDQIKDRPVSEVMTRNPIYVLDTDPVAAALCAMAAGGHRHVPVLTAEHKIAGIVSPLRLTAFLWQFLQR